MRRKTKTRRNRGPSKVKLLDQVDARACSEKCCFVNGSVSPPTIVSNERAAQLAWTGPPSIARCDGEDGPEVGLLKSEATPTEADCAEMQGLVDSPSNDDDIPDVQLSVIKLKV